MVVAHAAAAADVTEPISFVSYTNDSTRMLSTPIHLNYLFNRIK